VKKFGPYTDPIYNIKIFNESVSLKPKIANAKVKNVLNGKVILAQNTALLDNVVIVEHSDGMHTIYAHLDQIAPTVEKGKKIRKGSVIGRVKDELMFEVTQKNYHIDPMDLIH
jgi:murein DD-endopeptidase MepM/ murein hydrolase activator NlpD